jgi:thymidine phosphorylase
MLLLAEVETDLTTARERLEKTITDGSALAKFGEIVAVQGGDARVIDDPATILPSAKHQVPLVSDRSGLVQDVDAMEVALAALRLGAGRAKAEAEVDPAVGITDLVKVGETVEKGQPLAVVHANDDESLLVATTQLREGIAIGDSPVAIPPLIAERIA